MVEGIGLGVEGGRGGVDRKSGKRRRGESGRDLEGCASVTWQAADEGRLAANERGGGWADSGAGGVSGVGVEGGGWVTRED